MDNRVKFEKPPLSVADQLQLLTSRGLIINDSKTAEHYLKFISYYRFCGYGIEFENTPSDSEKRYQKGTTFEQILDCYVFDRKLRLLVIDAIERIEIAIRTIITNELATKYGAHWYLKTNLF
jgi:abortive infection bacteriophage resistance protein